jgi:hypothetical protein
MIELPWGEKWVAHYKEADGRSGMGICNHYTALSPLVAAIMNSGGRNIVITDESIRPRIIDGTINIIDEDNPALEHQQ